MERTVKSRKKMIKEGLEMFRKSLDLPFDDAMKKFILKSIELMEAEDKRLDFENPQSAYGRQQTELLLKNVKDVFAKFEFEIYALLAEDEATREERDVPEIWRILADLTKGFNKVLTDFNDLTDKEEREIDIIRTEALKAKRDSKTVKPSGSEEKTIENLSHLLPKDKSGKEIIN